MTRYQYRLVESATGRRLDTWFELTASLPVTGTFNVGTQAGGNCVIQGGRRGNLFWPRTMGGTLNQNKTGSNSIMDLTQPTGSGLPRYLIPLWGQSDAAGRGILAEAPADLPSAARCFLYDTSFDYGQSFEPANSITGAILSVLNDAASTYSPMTYMLQVLAQQDPTHEYVGIPCCVGGTDSSSWGLKSGSITELYGASIFRVRSAHLALGGTIPFMVLGQCTSNGASVNQAVSWSIDWNVILNQAELDLAGMFQGANLRCVFWKVQNTKPTGLAYTDENWSLLKASADSFVSANRKLFQMPGNTGSDNIHERTAGLMTLASGCANVAVQNGWI